MPSGPTRRDPALLRWGPLVLCAAVLLLLVLPALPGSVQLYDRDTSRCEFPFKAYLAARLRSGALPLWVPWTEAGTSLLGQVTPALFHPLTALYLLLPLELAFKLNHLCALPLAALGLYLLARALGADRFGAAAGALAYATSGWLISMTASNLHFALSAAAAPLALWGILRLYRAPSPLALFGAGALLALTALSGDPQWLLFCGYASLAGALVLGGGARAIVRRVLLAGGAGLLAIAVGAPALFPALARISGSNRAAPSTAFESAIYSVEPARLAGLAVPWAFDDQLEATNPGEDPPAFEEYFASASHRGFASTFALGLPALLLALCAKGRKRTLLLGAALFCLLASLGPALPLEPLLRAALPGYRLFRFPEKWLAPATLALSLCCALGASRLAREGAGARRFALPTAALALLFALAALALPHLGLAPWLIAHGNEHLPGPAAAFLASLRSGLLLEAGLLFALAAVAAALRSPGQAGAALALLCGTSGLFATGDSLFVAPLALLRAPAPLALFLRERAGPGPFRIDSDPGDIWARAGTDRRVGAALAYQQALATQWNGLYGIGSVAVYSSLNDWSYLRAWHEAPAAMAALFNVRFQVRLRQMLTPAEANAAGFVPGPGEAWLRALPPQPRAFLLSCAQALAPEAAGRALAARAFDPHRAAIVTDPAAAQGLSCAAPRGTARLEEKSPEELVLEVDSPGPALAVVSEHFDPGWTARIDEARAEAVQVDLAALGVRVPAGRHTVTLRFWPRGLTSGLATSAATLLAWLLVAVRQRRK